MIIAVIFHSVQVSHHSLIRLIHHPFKDVQGIVSRKRFLAIAFHVEGHEGGAWSILDGIFFKLVEVKTDFSILVEEGDLALDDLDKPHLEADFSDGEGEVGLFRDESYEGIASILGAKDDLYLDGLKQAILFILLHDRQDAQVVFAGMFDLLPDGGVDGRPGQTAQGLGTNLDGLEFEVVGLELELLDQILLELQKKTVAG